MFPPIYMLVLVVNECSICIYNGTKEFTSIGNVLPLIETQPWYIQISTIYHPFLRDSIGNTIMQCTEHITLDVYCKVQRVYLKIPILVSAGTENCMRHNM